MPMTPFFLGTTQTLSIGSLSLTLTAEDFDGGEMSGLGYIRTKDVSQQVAAAESYYGASLLDGPYWPARYQFAWGLQLLPAKLMLLLAIYEEQQHRFKNNIANASVRLRDQRIVLMERSPRNRAKVGTVANAPTAPTGFSFFWPQFNIMLEAGSDLYQWHSRPSNDLFKVKIAARELEIVPISEDV